MDAFKTVYKILMTLEGERGVHQRRLRALRHSRRNAGVGLQAADYFKGPGVPAGEFHYAATLSGGKGLQGSSAVYLTVKRAIYGRKNHQGHS